MNIILIYIGSRYWNNAQSGSSYVVHSKSKRWDRSWSHLISTSRSGDFGQTKSESGIPSVRASR